MPGGLSRRLKSAFVLQAVMACLVIVLGAFVAGSIAVDQVTRRYMLEEAATFWRERATDPAAPLPRSTMLRAYFAADRANPTQVPADLRGLEPGLHISRSPRRHVLVQDRPNGRLYIVYRHSQVAWYGVLLVIAPLALAVLAVLVSTRLTYRIVKRVVAPVDWLAREVARWDPREPDTRALAPDNLPVDAGQETRQLAGALQRMAERTRAFVRRERDFTRDASHELRTPLTVIRVASDMLAEDPDLPARASRSLKRIQRAGRDMEQVVDAFLILAREADVEPQREDFDVRDVVYEQVEQVRPLLVGKPVELNVLEAASPRLHASPRVLAVMLDNLLRNACTFTESGRIDVRIDSDRVIVQDTGIGMSEDILRRAYDPFYRADVENSSGKGMGLSIVRRLGERFDWPVSIESEPGRGTTAVIRFGG
jgi:signal transduction histidine kinase